MIDKKTEDRPWGRFEQFTHNQPSTVKIIYVKAGEQLSLQKHALRSEFWRVLKGNPSITIDSKVIAAKPGDEFFVEAEKQHRIAATEQDVEILEIAFGTFNEEDITRFEDKYGRL